MGGKSVIHVMVCTTQQLRPFSLSPLPSDSFRHPRNGNSYVLSAFHSVRFFPSPAKPRQLAPAGFISCFEPRCQSQRCVTERLEHPCQVARVGYVILKVGRQSPEHRRIVEILIKIDMRRTGHILKGGFAAKESAGLVSIPTASQGQTSPASGSSFVRIQMLGNIPDDTPLGSKPAGIVGLTWSHRWTRRASTAFSRDPERRKIAGVLPEIFLRYGMEGPLTHQAARTAVRHASRSCGSAPFPSLRCRTCHTTDASTASSWLSPEEVELTRWLRLAPPVLSGGPVGLHRLWPAKAPAPAGDLKAGLVALPRPLPGIEALLVTARARNAGSRPGRTSQATGCCRAGWSPGCHASWPGGGDGF